MIQSRGYYHCRIKSRKFYKYIYYFLFDVTITNTFILYRHSSFTGDGQEPLKLLSSSSGSSWPRSLLGDIVAVIELGIMAPLPFSHFPMKITASSPGQRNRGRCTYCYQQKKRCDSQWYCHECGVWLCHPGNNTKDCFLLWHKKYFSSIGTIR